MICNERSLDVPGILSRFIECADESARMNVVRLFASFSRLALEARQVHNFRTLCYLLMVDKTN